MQVVISGASGMLGSALVSHLRERGHQVTRLIRSGMPADDASLWDPVAGRIDQMVIDRADAVINLAGAPITHWPRTRRYRAELIDSRVSATTTIAAAIASSSSPPALLSGSGSTYYGADRGQDVLTEDSGPGEGFMGELPQRWEAAAVPASAAGARVCFLRTAPVIHRSGGILPFMLPPFRACLGATMGSGRQHMSVISLQDWTRAVEFLAVTDAASGPYNLAAPVDITNADFTDALGAALHRPTILAAPAFVLRAALGNMAGDLLGSSRVRPLRLQDAGFAFAEPDLGSIVESALR